MLVILALTELTFLLLRVKTYKLYIIEDIKKQICKLLDFLFLSGIIFIYSRFSKSRLNNIMEQH